MPDQTTPETAPETPAPAEATPTTTIETSPVKGKRQRKPKPAAVKKTEEEKAPAQTELEGMPERDGVGKAGKRYKDAVEALDAAQNEKGEAMQSLINALKKARRTSVQVEGYHFQYKHNGPSDKILTKKPK